MKKLIGFILVIVCIAGLGNACNNSTNDYDISSNEDSNYTDTVYTDNTDDSNSYIEEDITDSYTTDNEYNYIEDNYGYTIQENCGDIIGDWYYYNSDDDWILVSFYPSGNFAYGGYVYGLEVDGSGQYYYDSSTEYCDLYTTNDYFLSAFCIGKNADFLIDEYEDMYIRYE